MPGARPFRHHDVRIPSPSISAPSLGGEIGVPLEAVPYNGARPLIADLEKDRIPAGTGGITSFPRAPARRSPQATDDLRRQAHCRDRAQACRPCARAGIPQAPVQTNWYAFFAPPGMPAALVAAWTAELQGGCSSRAKSPSSFSNWASTVETSTPAEMAERASPRISRAWKATLDLLGIKSCQLMPPPQGASHATVQGVLAARLNQLPETQRVSIGPWDRLRLRQRP